MTIGGAGERRIWARVVPLVAPALLVAVGLNQLVLAHSEDLTSWKGGGFGMFATVDRLDERFITLTVRFDSQEATLTEGDLPDGDPWTRRVSRTLAMPDGAAMQRFGASVLLLDWVRDDGDVVLADRGPDGSTHTLTAEEVIVEVWGLDFDAAAGTLARTLIASDTVRSDGR